MGRSVEEILSSKRIMGVYERVKKGPTTLSTLFGFPLGGANEEEVGGRAFFYDTFNQTREVATARAPAAPTALIKPQKVGEVKGVFPRSAESMKLLDEKIHNLRGIGGPIGELDRRGEQYITRQEQYLATRFANLREFHAAAVIRGQYVYVQQGDDLHHDFTGSGISIDFQVPSGNFDQLDMLGAGAIIGASWATASTDIPAHLFSINDAMLELHGRPLEHAVCGSDVWQYVVNNTKVAAQGGTANVVFDRISQDSAGNFTAVLRALPWLQWHLVDHRLKVGTGNTSTKLIELDHIAFLPDPDPSWITYGLGSEMVTEGPNGVRAERFGTHPYAYPDHNPSGWMLNTIANGFPHLYVPSCVTYGDVTP